MIIHSSFKDDYYYYSGHHIFRISYDHIYAILYAYYFVVTKSQNDLDNKQLTNNSELRKIFEPRFRLINDEGNKDIILSKYNYYFDNYYLRAKIKNHRIFTDSYIEMHKNDCNNKILSIS